MVSSPALLLIIAVSLTFFSGINCQVEAKGRFKVGKFSKTTVAEHAIHQLPSKDNELLSKLADAEDSVTGAPFKFAEAIEYPIDINFEGQWVNDEESKFHLPDYAEFYVIGQERIHGAFTAIENNMEDHKFAVGLVKGDTLFLEYVEPLDVEKGGATIKLHKIVHGFRSVTAAGTSGACNIDAACPDGNNWKDQINAVGIMLTNDGQRFCSGTMVNNVRQDGSQLFLTANHCIFADVSYFMVGFNYQWSYCKSGNATGPTVEPPIRLVQGMKVLSKWDKSDFALLMIKERIPEAYNVFLAGWDQRPVAAVNAIGIHHPSGDVKKISTFIGTLQQSSWNEYPFRYHWMVPRWTRGVTEPGSSGSSLFNSRGLIVGQLHGGESACNYLTGYDLYGGIAWSWSSSPLASQRLSTYLNPTTVNVTSINGIYLNSARSRLGRGMVAKSVFLK